ncbi:hypothetical protein OG735_40210 [Streptomyces sp. NBC_01210]|nr:hypothetical protein OG735_40210 [Streptomyces sp. NBC_01210]
MKIQERCCQGLIASWSSQRRTVNAEMGRGDPADDGLARQFRARPA